MNLYFLLEGRRTEKRVYRAWIQHIFPSFVEVSKVEELVHDNFYLLAGEGYPSYCARIPNCLQDIHQHGQIDHYFVCIDAEENAAAEKFAEVESLITSASKFTNYHILVHDRCIETWFLGNSRMMRNNPHSEILREYKQFFDVSVDDPEEMACPASYEFCAHFHLDYLKAMLAERGLRYTKVNPGCVMEKHYLDALVERHIITGHISSFGRLVSTWRNIGGAI